MKKLFIAAATSAYVTSGVLAQTQSTATDPLIRGSVLSSQDGVTVVATPPVQQSGGANHFLVVCPSQKLDTYFNFRGHALVFLYTATRQEMANSVTEIEKRGFPVPADSNLPGFNMGLISESGIIPAYSLNQMAQNIQTYLAGADPLPSAAATDPRLHNTLRKHALDFCFSGS